MLFITLIVACCFMGSSEGQQGTLTVNGWTSSGNSCSATGSPTQYSLVPNVATDFYYPLQLTWDGQGTIAVTCIPYDETCCNNTGQDVVTVSPNVGLPLPTAPLQIYNQSFGFQLCNFIAASSPPASCGVVIHGVEVDLSTIPTAALTLFEIEGDASGNMSWAFSLCTPSSGIYPNAPTCSPAQGYVQQFAPDVQDGICYHSWNMMTNPVYVNDQVVVNYTNIDGDLVILELSCGISASLAPNGIVQANPPTWIVPLSTNIVC